MMYISCHLNIAKIEFISENAPGKRLDRYLAWESFGFTTSEHDEMAWSMPLFGCVSYNII